MGTRTHNSISGNICFEFSVPYSASLRVSYLIPSSKLLPYFCKVTYRYPCYVYLVAGVELSLVLKSYLYLVPCTLSLMWVPYLVSFVWWLFMVEGETDVAWVGKLALVPPPTAWYKRTCNPEGFY